MTRVRSWLYMTMRTRRQRRSYSAFGLALWIACCGFGFADVHVWSRAFAVATLIWAVTVFAYLARDHWENRP